MSLTSKPQNIPLAPPGSPGSPPTTSSPCTSLPAKLPSTFPLKVSLLMGHKWLQPRLALNVVSFKETKNSSRNGTETQPSLFDSLKTLQRTSIGRSEERRV